MLNAKRAGQFLLPVLAAAICGCGGTTEVYPVSGKVTYSDGTPVPGGGALVLLAKEAKEGDVHAIEGKIKSDGTFSLTTIDTEGGTRDGAPVGDYRVYVVPVAEDGATGQGGEGPEGDAGEDELPEITSMRFGDPETSGITITVEAKENTGIEIQVERPDPSELAEQ